VNACLAPVVACHGLAVTTVEGIGNAKKKLHAVQERLSKSHGSQCGFCTPGIVMSMYTLLRNNPLPTMKEMETYFQGNLCRCTGYRPILEGFRTFTEEWTKFGKNDSTSMESCGRPGGCCRDKGGSGGNEVQVEKEEEEKLFIPEEFAPYSPTQEPLFPPELMVNSDFDNQCLEFRGKSVTWFRPTSLHQLLTIKQQHPDAKIVVGNTELGVEVKFKHCEYPVYINPSCVKELNQIEVTDDGLVVGAAVTLTKIEDMCLHLMKTMQEEKTSVFREIVSMLQWFAGKQIRNVAAVGGNIMTGSPISDLNPIFMAARSSLRIQSAGNDFTVPFNQDFYTAYRKNIVKPYEILVSLTIPFTNKNQYFYAFKQARRRDDDIAIVNSAFNIQLQPDKSPDAPLLSDICMAFGGMGPTTVMAKQAMKALTGKTFNTDLIEEGCQLLQQELSLAPNAPGAMVRYRTSLVLSFFFKTCCKIRKHLGVLLPDEESVTKEFEKEPLNSHQMFEIKDNKVKDSGLGKPLKHKAADYQVDGTAQYTDDIPSVEGELYAGLVMSTKAHAQILSINADKALAMEGVHTFVCAKDLTEKQNTFGTTIVQDERVFADKFVHCVGNIIGVILANDQDTAQKAARAVQVEYKVLPAIITIDEAIKQQSYHHMHETQISCGDVDSVFATAQHVVQGEMRTGAQEQFYLETNACIAIPKQENNEMEIFASTQNPTLTQNIVANTLGVPANRVNVRVKRMGGGFGGKESRSVPISAVIAAAANKAGRPVRIMLDRDEDMLVSGFRHPFYGRYKVAFTKEGKILAVDTELYANAGWSMDLTFAVVERGMFHSDNSYKVPNLRVRGYSCKTNLASNTAFRGFGGPQGLMVAETWIEKVASKLDIPAHKVREINLYQEGMKTHFNQVLNNCTLQTCWDQCKQISRYEERKTEIEKFNKNNRWTKRGISMVPVKFGIAFTATFMNQSGALVMVYSDGSVLVSHGGTEMGQGLHTKMIQVASQALEIDHKKIHINETSTDKVPNTSPTAASAGSDLNGMAVLEACLIIKKRLQPYKEANPQGSWEDWVKSAYFDRVSLSTTGFHATPDIGYDFKTNSGNPFNYFTYGVACSEVEIDCLTGDHQVISTNIVMDLGESINPAIDIGQIEGAFMQGYGLFLLEQILHTPQGSLITRGPGAYKIPSFNDIPGVFNVSLLRGAPNPRAVFSSKAVGEPPLFLAASVFFAVKDAISAARKQNNLSAWFDLDAPATAERIRMSCADRFTAKVAELPESGFTPWGIQV